MNKKWILIVEDDNLFRKTIRIMLEHNGYAITEACNGKEGVNRFRNNPDYDLILTDFQMPEMDGSRMSLKIHQIDRDVPIVMMTGRNDLGEEDIRQWGIQRLINKPFHLDALNQLVGQMIQP